MSELKRLMYISRFADSLSAAEVRQIGRISKRNNGADDITGVLVASGGVFFQVLEGPAARVDAAYARIMRDPRHTDVVCLKTEQPAASRMFPDWSMGAINVDEQNEEFALPIRAMLQSLEHAYRVIARYTQPKVAELIVKGINPLAVPPVKVEKVVLFADLEGFSMLSEQMETEEVILLLDTWTDICGRRIASNGGELSRFTGDGLLAYFPAGNEDAAVEASLGILDEMQATADFEAEDSPLGRLRCGIALTRGVVVEGNVGSSLKKEFTIYGDAVNTAARVQDLTRTLGKPLLVSAEVRSHAQLPWDFELEGTHTLRGKSRPVELYSLSREPRRLFPVEGERERITREFSATRSRMARSVRDGVVAEETARAAQQAASRSATAITGEVELPWVGRYEVLKELGRGAMGRVYLAHDSRIGRKVAIKTLDLRDGDDAALAERRATFFHEAEAAGKLSHPGIVVVHDAGEDDGLAFIAMEYLDGFDLTRHTRRGRLLPPAVALKVAGRVGRALHYAHARSVIHRDIKPGNIMVLKSRDVKVTDFGIARLADSARTLSAGAIVGSPAYMSPEQVNGREVDHRSDLFSLGVVLYELLTGQRPFQGDTLGELMGAIAGQPHADVREHAAELPEAVSRLVDRALAKRREQRFDHGEAFVASVLGALRSLSTA